MSQKEQAQEMWDKWLNAWDKAAADFAQQAANELAQSGNAPPPEQPVKKASWLVGGAPMDGDWYGNGQDQGDFSAQAEPDWQDIYNRSQDLHGLITDSVENKPAWGAPTPTKTNPTRQDTTGPDQGYGPGVPVTKNWSDGDDLRELDDIKRRVEAMERKYHAEDVNGGGSALKKQLESLRDQINTLSEKINRLPKNDVT